MALSTLCGQAQHRFADAVDAVEHFDHSKLFCHNRAFFVDHAVSQKSCRDDLLLRRVRQQIASNLFDKKLVVGHVAIEGINHPVTPRPLLTRHIFLVAVGVGITSQIQPVSCPLFTKTIALEQRLNRSCSTVRLDGGQFLRRRRQSDQVQIDSPTQR